jgi:hypothetical protein
VAVVVTCVLILIGGLVDHRGLGGIRLQPSRRLARRYLFNVVSRRTGQRLIRARMPRTNRQMWRRAMVVKPGPLDSGWLIITPHMTVALTSARTEPSARPSARKRFQNGVDALTRGGHCVVGERGRTAQRQHQVVAEFQVGDQKSLHRVRAGLSRLRDPVERSNQQVISAVL